MKNTIPQQVMIGLHNALHADDIQKAVVGAVIDMGENKPLLLKRRSDDFMGGLVELPSGTVEANESLEEALMREVWEETGLVIDEICAFLGTFDYLSKSGKKTRQFNFKITVANNNMRLSCEHEAYYAYDLKSADFQSLNISADTKNIINKAFE